ncbi:TPA: hypothetical protein CPT81_05340 [Candidatus Gastranaerophilales bacterium HUM_20]|nr:unknown [Clostridium sp. CAG:729]DAB21290.1 MAG TPA: hypothetical protein CPT81_05340 [Candidatus Gastranaerophilales bacterium HUM_20]
MKNQNLLTDVFNSLSMSTASKELLETIQNAFKQYEWKVRSERIKAGIREAKLRKASKAE